MITAEVPTLWVAPRNRSMLRDLHAAAVSAQENAQEMVSAIKRFTTEPSVLESHLFEEKLCIRRLSAADEFVSSLDGLIENEDADLLLRVNAEASLNAISDFIWDRYKELGGDGVDLGENFGNLLPEECRRVSVIGLSLTWAADVLFRSRMIFDPISEAEREQYRALSESEETEVANA